MRSSKSPYPPEFRRGAVRLVRESGKSRRQIARELDVSTETLRQWVKQAELDDGLRHDGLTSEETEEVRQLSARANHRVLKLARTIADLAGSDHIETSHLAEALQYRPREWGWGRHDHWLERKFRRRLGYVAFSRDTLGSVMFVPSDDP